MANPPTLEDILVAIKSIKSTGLDGIPAEIYKHGGTALPAQLLKFYRIYWIAKEPPQQFKGALIIAIYKKKGDRSDCKNYRGISLLSTAGKIWQNPSEKITDHCRGDPFRKLMWISSVTLYNRHDIHLAITTGNTI